MTDLPFLGEGDRNFNLWLSLLPTFLKAGAPEVAGTGQVVGNTGAINQSPTWGGLFALDYTAPKDWNMIGLVFGNFRVDQAYTGAWVWGQGRWTVSGGATLVAGAGNQVGYVLHGSGVFFTQSHLWGVVRVPKGKTAHILIEAVCQLASIHAWTATSDNEITGMFWKESQT